MHRKSRCTKFKFREFEFWISNSRGLFSSPRQGGDGGLLRVEGNFKFLSTSFIFSWGEALPSLLAYPVPSRHYKISRLINRLVMQIHKPMAIKSRLSVAWWYPRLSWSFCKEKLHRKPHYHTRLHSELFQFPFGSKLRCRIDIFHFPMGSIFDYQKMKINFYSSFGNQKVITHFEEWGFSNFQNL